MGSPFSHPFQRRLLTGKPYPQKVGSECLAQISGVNWNCSLVHALRKVLDLQAVLCVHMYPILASGPTPRYSSL